MLYGQGKIFRDMSHPGYPGTYEQPRRPKKCQIYTYIATTCFKKRFEYLGKFAGYMVPTK